MNKKIKNISDVTVTRFSAYHRILWVLDNDGIENVFSHDLAKKVGTTSDLVRKDISSLNIDNISNINYGYNVKKLYNVLHKTLGLDKPRNVILIGVGNLGQAILKYRGNCKRGYNIDILFDEDPDKIGQKFQNSMCYDIQDLEKVMNEKKYRIAILSVPAAPVLSLVQRLSKIKSIKCILNFSPINIKLNNRIVVENVDFFNSLDKLSYYAKEK